MDPRVVLVASEEDRALLSACAKVVVSDENRRWGGKATSTVEGVTD